MPAERTGRATLTSAERTALATVMSAERSALATGAAASALAAGPEPRRRSDQGAAATLTGDTARERFRRLDPISTMMAVGGYRPARGVGE
jgi:hypothetical protein